jgi:hypothetical protein
MEKALEAINFVVSVPSAQASARFARAGLGGRPRFRWVTIQYYLRLIGNS